MNDISELIGDVLAVVEKTDWKNLHVKRDNESIAISIDGNPIFEETEKLTTDDIGIDEKRAFENAMNTLSRELQAVLPQEAKLEHSESIKIWKRSEIKLNRWVEIYAPENDDGSLELSKIAVWLCNLENNVTEQYLDTFQLNQITEITNLVLDVVKKKILNDTDDTGGIQ